VVSLSSIGSYIRKKALAAGLINMILNPLLVFLLNREINKVALPGILIDTIITSIVMTWLVAVFSAADVNRQLRAGNFKDENLPQPGPYYHGCRKEGPYWELYYLSVQY
jgi:hypothetical protein